MMSTSEGWGKEKTFQVEAANKVAPIVQQALQKGLLTEENPVMDFISFDELRLRLLNLKDAFPEEHINHAIAMKANPLRGCFRLVKEMGFGSECASYQEVMLSLSLGFEPRYVIYDSPCKLKRELKQAFENGCYINLDNEVEIKQVAEILEELNINSGDQILEKRFGLRINPVIGAGSIAACSTANLGSKFGLPLLPSTQDRLMKILKENSWIQGLHIHVGSQGCSLGMLVEGVKKMYDFAEHINTDVGYNQVKILDIGGGVPTNYDSNVEAYDYHAYRDALTSKLPELFSGKYDLITEFGRSVFTKSGITVSKVEATKCWEGQNTSIIHVGANQFVRTAYLPEQVYHRISVLDSAGNVKKGVLVKQDIAGPMCFGGDFVSRGAMLPQIETGDYVVMHDTAAYTMSMYSRYNSICASAVYGFRKEDQMNGQYKFWLLKERETPEEVLAFWGV